MVIMAFNISGFFQNIASGTTASENQSVEGAQNTGTTGSTQQAGSVNPQFLSSLLAGDTLTGIISSIKNNQVTLNLSNGESILARLATETQLQLGQTMTFMIQENTGNFISLKPLIGDAQQSVMVQKALEAAGLVYNETNAAIVEELLSRNMSIDSVTINEMIKNNLKFPNADLDTIANLVKLHIPVTAENIQQYEAYTHYEHNMAGQLKNLPDNFLESLIHITTNTPDGIKEAATFLENITASLYTGIPEETANTPINTYLNETDRNQFAARLHTLFGNAADELVLQIKEGTISTKEALIQTARLLDTLSFTETNAAGLSKEQRAEQLFSSKELGQLLKTSIQETMYLTPQAAGSADSIKNFYKRIRSTLEHTVEEVNRHTGDSPLSKNLNEIKSNIDFMNDLNRNMTYFQMPVRFSEGTGNGELYVFTNKKALKHSSDNISALLHLDMEHLGPLDVYVKLSGKNVSTNFCLESEEMLNFIYEHIDQLHSRLEALGYAPHFEMKVIENEEQFDFEKDFLNKDVPALSTSQYIFDIKA